MSELYLVLRRRLEQVPEWVYLPTADLKAARGRAGLSYENLARELHVSSKTWERYEKAGRVPRHLMPAVVRILDLEIEEPKVGPIIARAETVDEQDERAQVARVLAAVEELRGEVRELLEVVREDRVRAGQGRGQGR